MANYKKISNVSSDGDGDGDIELEQIIHEAVNPLGLCQATNNVVISDTSAKEDEADISEWLPPEKSIIHLRNAELIKSVCENLEDEVSRLLGNGEPQDRVSADATCEQDNLSVVHIAALDGNDKILEILLAHGARARRMDNSGRSPLHYAVRANHVACVKLLLARCPDLASIKVGEFYEHDIENSLLDCSVHDHASLRTKVEDFAVGLSPLHLASQFGHVESVNLLLKVGAKVHELDGSGLTTLDVAGEHLPANPDEKLQRESFLKLITKLIERGCRASGKTSPYRTTPLHVAVKMQSVDAIKKLLAYGYDALIPDASGDNSLHVCAKEHLQDSLKVLLSSLFLHKSKVDEKNAAGFTPLHLAVLTGWVTGAKLLLDTGSSVLVLTADFASGHEHESILHLAARSGQTAILELLLKCNKIKEVVNTCNIKGESPLFHTVFGKSVDSLRLLVKAGADVALLAMGRTIFHQMIEYDQPDLLAALFENAPSPTSYKNVVEVYFKWAVLLKGTPLHMAAFKGNVACVEVLLRNGCDVTATMLFNERKGHTALHLAAATGHQLVIRALLKHDPSLVEDVTDKDWLPIHLACQYGLQGSVQTLLEAGSDLSAKCEDRDGKKRSAMYLLMHRVRSPVKVLRKVLDNSIVQMDTYVSVNYKVLLPKAKDESGIGVRSDEIDTDGVMTSSVRGLPMVHERRVGRRSNQMKVIDTLLQTGNKMKQHELMMHPLIESFLHLQWKTLRFFYYALIVLYSCFVLSFTMEVIALYNLQDLKIVMLNVDLFRWTAFAFLIVLILHEAIYLMQLKIDYFLQFESWVKLLCYMLVIMVTFVNHEQEWPRELTAAAVLLSWLEFMLLFYKVPKVGYSVLMFSKVASNLFGVLLTFAFLIIGFAITFMIEFRVQPPFESTFEAIVKTIVMMTSEFDYSDLFQDFKGNMFSLIIAKLIFVLFLMLVGIVLMNLLVAMAVTDIKDLGNQGNLDRLRKQAEFVSIFEKIVFDNIFIRCLPKSSRSFILNHKQVPTVLRLSVMEEQEHFKVTFHHNLRNSILERANINRKKYSKTKQEEKSREEKRLRKIQESKELEELKKQINNLTTSTSERRKFDNFAFSKLDRRVSELSISNDKRTVKIDQHQQEAASNSDKILKIVETKERADNVHLNLIRSKLNDLTDFEKKHFETHSKRSSDIERILQRILSLLEKDGQESPLATSVRKRVHEIQSIGTTTEGVDANTFKLRHERIVSLLTGITTSLEKKLANEESKMQQMNKTISSLVISHRDFAAANYKAMEDLLKSIGDLSKSIDVLTKKTTPRRM